MEHEAFRSGNFDTKFVEQYFKPELLNNTSQDPDTELIASALASIVFEDLTTTNGRNDQSSQSSDKANPWRRNRK